MSVQTRKVLLVGPYPPPFGGISVHVRNAHELLTSAGVECALLNIEKGAPAANAPTFAKELIKYASKGWTIHVHTNGHNRKSWLIALAGGVASRFGAGGVLTLHSGGAPAYLRSANGIQRIVARAACALFNRIVCVNAEQARLISSFGAHPDKVSIVPAYLPTPLRSVSVPGEVDEWMLRRRPIISTALFFRQEYGFELLIDAIAALRHRHPDIGCLVMGSRLGAEAAEARVRDKGLEGSVLIAGDLHHDLCVAMMARSDLFVRTTFQDGDSISVREALSLGIPVVASNVGNRPEGVKLFEVGNLNELIESIDQSLSTGSTGTTATQPPAGSSLQLTALYNF
jgi:glycogen synthase